MAHLKRKNADLEIEISIQRGRLVGHKKNSRETVKTISYVDSPEAEQLKNHIFELKSQNKSIQDKIK